MTQSIMSETRIYNHNRSIQIFKNNIQDFNCITPFLVQPAKQFYPWPAKFGLNAYCGIKVSILGLDYETIRSSSISILITLLTIIRLFSSMYQIWRGYSFFFFFSVKKSKSISSNGHHR